MQRYRLFLPYGQALRNGKHATDFGFLIQIFKDIRCSTDNLIKVATEKI